MNEVYGDDHPGATTLPDAGFGYGQTPDLTAVSALTPITAAQWTGLFQTIRKSGAHQGTAVVPPLPVSDPMAGDEIAAYNTPTTLASLVSLVRTNRFILAPGQSAQTVATSAGTSAPWEYSLSYTFQVNIGTWNQARYFFNSGGSIGIVGSYPGSGFPVGSDDYMWYTFLNQVGTIVVKATTTTALLANNATSGGGNPTAGGMWDAANNPLTTTYETIYYRLFGGAGYYNASTIRLEARLAAAAPTVGSGTIQFRITLSQPTGNLPVDAKLLSTTFNMTETHSAMSIPFLSGSGGPGPASVVITPGTFVRT
jgi:hypothetical protein